MSQKAYFALGCFWGPQEHFDNLPGVLDTRVGYSGGEKENPTYHDLGNHAETVEIEFDPEMISYGKLLEHFFMEHDPSAVQIPQYRSAIFYLDEDQHREADGAVQKTEAKLKRKLSTSVEPFKKFYPAEEYHQKYFEKRFLGNI